MSEEEKLQLENECLLKYSKAQMIQKYIDELEENCTLSDLWCKSQEENKELKQKVKYYENFEINKTVDKIRLENNKREKELQNQLQQKENILKEVREDLYQVVKWCTENKHNENTIKRYLVVDYGTIVGKINEIRTKLDKEVN